jgi:hypothetical protein
MALTVIHQPNSIAGVRDPQWYELRCDGWEEEAPETASFTIVLVQNPDPGMTFVLNLPDVALVFTYVSDPPDDSGLQVRVGADSTATTAYLVAALESNWHVDQLFVVTEASGTITLTAREPGAVEASLVNTSPVTMAFATVDAGSDGTYADNYSANMQLWVERVWGSDVYEPVAAYSADPDPDELVRWNISSLLLPYLSWRWPNYGTTAMRVLTEHARRYYLTRWELHGTPPVAKKVSRSSTLVAWLAGSRRAERGTIHEIWSLLTRTDIANPFLTHRGRAGRQEVSAAQDHYIAWYRRVPKVSGQQLDLRATVTYSDASTSSATLITDTNGSGWDQYLVAQFPVGFERMGLDALEPTKVPVKYSVVVRSHTGTALSEAHTFWLADTDANERHIEYVSSLGFVESLRCTGQWQLGLRATHDEARRLLPVVNGALPTEQEAETLQYLRGADKPLDVFTGWMPRGEFGAVVPDLLLSPSLRLVETERETRTPLRVAEVELVIDKRGQPDEWMYGANLRLMNEDPEMAWSDRLHWPDLPDEAEPGGS